MMTQTTESPKLRFRADDGSEFPKWKSMPMRSLFSEVIEKKHPEYPVLSIRQGCGTILRDSSDRNIEYDKSNLTNYKVIEKGDFIIHLRSFEGGLECSALQGISSPAYRILRSDCIIPEAYKDYFRSHEFINHRLSEAVVGIRDGKNIDMNIFWEIKVPYMALPEQQKIADFLSAYDKKIFLQKERVETLKEQKKGLLQKMFPKKGETVPELRFPGFTGDWEQRKAIDIADYSKGNGYSKGDLTDAGTPIILYGRLYTKYQFAISEVDTFAVPRNGAVYSQGNEVIVPASGETAEDIARASAVEKSGVLLGGDLNILRPFDFINPLFLALAISNGEPQKELAKKAQGKSVVHIHNTDIQEVTIAYPSRTEQDRIVSVFRQLDNLITLHQRKLETMQEIKKGLLQQMFV